MSFLKKARTKSANGTMLRASRSRPPLLRIAALPFNPFINRVGEVPLFGAVLAFHGKLVKRKLCGDPGSKTREPGCRPKASGDGTSRMPTLHLFSLRKEFTLPQASLLEFPV
jgi:hypothetical protein